MACIVIESGGTKVRFVVNQFKTGATGKELDFVCQRTMQSAKLAKDGTITFVIDFPRSPEVYRKIVEQAIREGSG